MGITVLAVDDSNSIRQMLQFALKSRGYGVIPAGDGVEALEALERGRFDLMVLDINMPRLDGLSLLKVLRERPEWQALPVLVLTTEGQDEDRDRALALGATDYMRKPFRPTELLDRVASMLDKATQDIQGIQDER
jgi:two-component system chemotaxis response regulator CheY